MMKKFISVLVSILIAVSAAIPCFAANEVLSPEIIKTVYPTDDVVVADITVSADSSGVKDVTADIQQAIDICAANGGGTVWLPAGRYRVTGNIYIRQFVTLMGDYQNPDEGKDYGTVIIANVESSDAMNPALFTVGASAGAVGLTVWYPNQNINDIKPYPFTFYIVGNGDYMLQTIKNCTLINSYRGIGASAECENGIYECHEMMTVENVRGTFLYQAMNAHNSADVDTVKTFYVSNKYWYEAGEEYNAPEKEKLDAYTRKNGYGMIIGDLEWPQFADVRISDRYCGIEVKEGTRYTFSGEFTDLYITDCDYGIFIPEGNIISRGYSWGMGISNGVIEGSEYAVYDPGKNATVMTNVEIEGKVKGKNIRRYSADTTSLTPDYEHKHIKPAEVLYVVSADKTGKTDAALAVQNKLDEASATGGIVYLPAGLYRFESPLTVPAGVEFRGSSSVGARCQSGNSSGTLILSYYGFNDADKPLITLGGNQAGVSGIRVDYPLNNPVDASGNYMKTTPVIYSEYDDIYVINCCLTLASCGIKLKNSDNAFVKKLVGCCYESMFDLTDCNNTFIEACLQNANTLPRNGYANFGIPRFTENFIFDYVFIPITRIHTDYIKLNSCNGVRVFNTFIYGGKSFLNSVNSEAEFVNIGHDGSSKTEPAFIMSDGKITLLNSMRSTSDGKHGFNFYSIENGTKFKSYNSQSVDMLYSEHPVIENIGFSELDGSEKLYGILQYLYKFIAFFGRIYMLNEQ